MSLESQRRDYEKILVVKLRHIGDLLLSTPVFAALKQHFPGAEIFAVSNPGTEQVVTGNPHLAGVLTPPRAAESTLRRWRSELRFVRELRRKQFDLAIDLTTSDRSAILTRLTGASTRLGYRSFKGFLGRRKCYTATVAAQRHEHIISKHLRLLEPLGITNPAASVVFVVSEAARAKVAQLLPPDREFFQVHPVSRVEKKNWPANYFAELVDAVAARGWLPVLTGSSDPAEQAWLGALRTQLKSEYLDLSGRLTLPELGAVSERARCFLGVDTAPMHIAASVGTPVLAIFGPTSERMWAPWCERKLIISRTDLDCRLPCQNKHGCPHIACLREMRPAEVLPKVEKFLAGLMAAQTLMG